MSIMANDLVRFEQNISEYQDLKKQVDTNFELLVQHVNEMNLMWEGEAYETFKARFENDRVKATEVIDQLAKVYEDLKYAHSEYAKCETAVTGIIDNIQV